MEKLIAFFEIPSVNFERAVKFYETFLNIRLERCCDCGNEKMAFFPVKEGEPTGAISWSAGFKPSADGVLIHLNVDDITPTLAVIEKNGGKTLCTKTKIEAEGVGYFALFIDSEGNKVGLYADK